MGAVYKYRGGAWGGKRGRYIYNRDRLHKVGFYKADKMKHQILTQEFKELKKKLGL